jgi:hypothetical protein
MNLPNLENNETRSRTTCHLKSQTQIGSDFYIKKHYLKLEPCPCLVIDLLKMLKPPNIGIYQ